MISDAISLPCATIARRFRPSAASIAATNFDRHPTLPPARRPGLLDSASDPGACSFKTAREPSARPSPSLHSAASGYRVAIPSPRAHVQSRPNFSKLEPVIVDGALNFLGGPAPLREKTFGILLLNSRQMFARLIIHFQSGCARRVLRRRPPRDRADVRRLPRAESRSRRVCLERGETRAANRHRELQRL